MREPRIALVCALHIIAYALVPNLLGAENRASNKCTRLLVTQADVLDHQSDHSSEINIKAASACILLPTKHPAYTYLPYLPDHLSSITMRSCNYVKIQPRGGELPRPSCEACKKKHNGTYGSGRFCSSSCARSVGGRTHQRNSKSSAHVKRDRSSTNSGKMSVKGLLNPM